MTNLPEPTRTRGVNWAEEYCCADCGHDTSERGLCEFYMVTDEVWAEAWTKKRGRWKIMLCIACLESRLGRVLNRDDFTPCPLNLDDRPHPKSLRLRSRLARTSRHRLD